MKDDILNELHLPLSSPNEDLETISVNNFKPLFDVRQFEIRSESTRDKGIDFHIELKAASASGEPIYTNFRFAVQLKATESIKINTDNSISLQLNTSNINYLLRNPMPAYYILFFKETGDFYVESINDFVATLYNKDENWNEQQTHTIRLSKKLDANAIQKIYSDTMKKGKFQRIINEKTILMSESANTEDKVLFDSSFNVTADSEIRKIIEAIGLDLVNEGKWSEILAVHRKASGTINNTAMYSLVLGIANYHSGKWMDALSFFNSAKKLKSELSEELQNHMTFIEAKIKYAIGIINQEKFEEMMKELEKADYLGLYIRMENAKNVFIENMDGPGQHEKLIEEMQSILDHPDADESIKLNVESELLLLEGHRINMKYIQTICRINAYEVQVGPDFELRKNAILNFLEEDKKWNTHIQDVKSRALYYKNQVVYFNTIMIETKIRYQFIAQAANISIVIKVPGSPELEMPDRTEMCESLVDNATLVFDFFNQIGHVENCIATMSLLYEILHFSDRLNEANKFLNAIEKLVESYDLTEHRIKLKYLKNQGTTHELFKNWMNEINSKSEAAKAKYMQQREEMIAMDADEKKHGNTHENETFRMMLFPIGYFQFPANKKETVYKILNMTESARAQFDYMFQMAMPVANIYYDVIDQEGYKDGKAADTGIERWTNIYRIRKAFYENKFYRFEPKL